ncbi:MAG: ABC transporter substrate-binding protein [Planctomycetales bacterium]|nr:ABC transporter substrate-binding protein [Planctomycetales bacterium]
MLLGLVMCLGCESRAPAPNGVPRPVQLQLNWIPDAQHGGFLAAETDGCFAAEGLDIAIKSGGPGTPVLQKLAMGQVDFAIANADQVLLARAQGADVVALFAALQNSPRCVMVRESSGIETLDQLHDLTLALGEGKAFAEFLKSHVPLERVRVVPYVGSVAAFLAQEDYAQQGYVFSEPLVVRALGVPVRALMVSDLGFNPYSSCVVTRSEMIEQHPEIVAKTISAIARGWQIYLESPEKANAEIRVRNSDMPAEILAQAASEVARLVQPGDLSFSRDRSPSHSLGRMTRQRWQQLADQLVELGMLDEQALQVDDAFTNRFLPSAQAIVPSEAPR